MKLLARGTYPRKLIHMLAAICGFAGMAALFAFTFERLPIAGTSQAIDWLGFYQGIQGGRLVYHPLLHNPPWSLLVLLPLGWLTPQASWGVLTFTTLAILVASVPRAPKGVWYASVAAVTLSFPALRNYADGNLEGLVLAGILLLLSSYRSQNPLLWAAGLLLATAKIQGTWILLLAATLGAVRFWPARRWAYPSLAAALFAAAAIWLYGKAWWECMWNIPYKATCVNMGMAAALSRLNTPPALILLAWLIVAGITLLVCLRERGRLPRLKAGALISASLVLAPYAAANSYLIVLAIGIIPLFQEKRGLGLAMLAVINLPYLAPWLGKPTWLYSEYWTAVTLLSWAVFAGMILLPFKISPSHETPLAVEELA